MIILSFWQAIFRLFRSLTESRFVDIGGCILRRSEQESGLLKYQFASINPLFGAEAFADFLRWGNCFPQFTGFWVEGFTLNEIVIRGEDFHMPHEPLKMVFCTERGMVFLSIPCSHQDGQSVQKWDDFARGIASSFHQIS